MSENDYVQIKLYYDIKPEYIVQAHKASGKNSNTDLNDLYKSSETVFIQKGCSMRFGDKTYTVDNNGQLSVFNAKTNSLTSYGTKDIEMSRAEFQVFRAVARNYLFENPPIITLSQKDITIALSKGAGLSESLNYFIQNDSIIGKVDSAKAESSNGFTATLKEKALSPDGRYTELDLPDKTIKFGFGDFVKSQAAQPAKQEAPKPQPKAEAVQQRAEQPKPAQPAKAQPAKAQTNPIVSNDSYIPVLISYDNSKELIKMEKGSAIILGDKTYKMSDSGELLVYQHGVWSPVQEAEDNSGKYYQNIVMSRNEFQVFSAVANNRFEDQKIKILTQEDIKRAMEKYKNGGLTEDLNALIPEDEKKSGTVTNVEKNQDNNGFLGKISGVRIGYAFGSLLNFLQDEAKQSKPAQPAKAEILKAQAKHAQAAQPAKAEASKKQPAKALPAKAEAPKPQPAQQAKAQAKPQQAAVQQQKPVQQAEIKPVKAEAPKKQNKNSDKFVLTRIVGYKTEDIKMEKGCSITIGEDTYRMDNSGQLQVYNRNSEKWNDADQIKMTAMQYNTFKAVSDNNDEEKGIKILSEKDVELARKKYRHGELTDDLSEHIKKEKINGDIDKVKKDGNGFSLRLKNYDNRTKLNMSFDYGLNKAASNGVKLEQASVVPTRKSKKSRKSKKTFILPQYKIDPTTTSHTRLKSGYNKYYSPNGGEKGKYGTLFGININSAPGSRHITNGSDFHKGLDLEFSLDQNVGAFCSGKVHYAGVMRGFGNSVVIEDANGYRHVYGHLSSYNVKAGDYISKGKIIGKAGCSGTDKQGKLVEKKFDAHLHYGIWCPNGSCDGHAIDPRKYEYPQENS